MAEHWSIFGDKPVGDGPVFARVLLEYADERQEVGDKASCVGVVAALYAFFDAVDDANAKAVGSDQAIQDVLTTAPAIAPCVPNRNHGGARRANLEGT